MLAPHTDMAQLIMTLARGQGRVLPQGEHTDSACTEGIVHCAPLTPTPAASLPLGADPSNDLEMTKEAQIRGLGGCVAQCRLCTLWSHCTLTEHTSSPSPPQPASPALPESVSQGASVCRVSGRTADFGQDWYTHTHMHVPAGVRWTWSCS
jgi:hypothetical protein